MKNEQSKLGELFKQAFDDFKPEPSSNVWEKIAQRPELTSPITPSTGISWWKWMLGGASLTAVIIAVVLTTSTSEKTVSPVQPTPAPIVTKAVQNNTNTSNTVQNQETQTITQQSNGTVISTPKQSTQNQDKNTSNITAVSPLPIKAGINTQNSTNIASILTEKAIVNTTPPTSTVKTVVNIDNTNNPSSGNLQEPIISDPSPKEGIEVISDTSICKGKKLVLWANGGTAYVWNTGEKTETINVNPSATTIYSVTITNHTGETTSYDITVSVLDCNMIFIPNSFSPDGDGDNDIYRVSGTDITNFTMRIFSRSGQIIFETKDINEGWDGRLKGKRVEMGVYVVQIIYTDNKGEGHNERRNITIIK